MKIKMKWKVIWNYRGHYGGEKLFEKNNAAQAYAQNIFRKPGVTKTEVKYVGV